MKVLDFSRQSLETFDISHAFLPLTTAKLATHKTVRFLDHPVSSLLLCFVTLNRSKVYVTFNISMKC